MSLPFRAVWIVALRKESVDRNQVAVHFVGLSALSLSARRAWIEIAIHRIYLEEILSLSARRAWIEIRTRSQPSKPRRVALRKESVDRNYIIKITESPRGVALRKESVDRNLTWHCISEDVS